MRRSVPLFALALAVLGFSGFGGGDRGRSLPAFGPPSTPHQLRLELRVHATATERVARRLASAAIVVPKLLPFEWPASGTITGTYGHDGSRPHPGIDIGVLRSLTVRAAAAGRVIDVGYTRGFEGYGKVVVEQVGRYTVVYAHLSEATVKVGQRLARGKRIGEAGCTGWCTGTHLHFEVRKGKQTVDPLRMLAKAS